MSEKNVWLIRHGESTSNAGVWHPVPKEILLTPTGQQQAQAIAEQMTRAPDLIVVSPFQRSLATAAPTRQRWPQVPVEVWPIEEITYLSPSACHHLSSIARKERVADYWEKADPFFKDGADAESFADFVERLRRFQVQLQAQKGFVVAIGHGQFFKAFMLGLEREVSSTSEWMRWFRQQEVAHPLKNGQIIPLKIE